MCLPTLSGSKPSDLLSKCKSWLYAYSAGILNIKYIEIIKKYLPLKMTITNNNQMLYI